MANDYVFVRWYTEPHNYGAFYSEGDAGTLTFETARDALAYLARVADNEYLRVEIDWERSAGESPWLTPGDGLKWLEREIKAYDAATDAMLDALNEYFRGVTD